MTVTRMGASVATLNSDVEGGTGLALAGDVVVDTVRDRGLGEHGCSHYRRRCKIRAPCCNELFDCRHCHNDSKNAEETPSKARHEIERHLIKEVVCSLCGTEQEVRQVCRNCGVLMGAYFCGVCNFYDDNTSKEHFHCDKCGICRVGGRKNFFHCDVCGCCYNNLLQNGHKCVEKSMHHNCPVCFEYLFDSLKDISVLKDCGHTIHSECLQDLQKHRYTCPICCKSMVNMRAVWEQMDVEVASTPMPEPYASQKTPILCNDCGATSVVRFHVVGHKCPPCGSYNTRQIQ